MRFIRVPIVHSALCTMYQVVFPSSTKKIVIFIAPNCNKAHLSGMLKYSCSLSNTWKASWKKDCKKAMYFIEWFAKTVKLKCYHYFSFEWTKAQKLGSYGDRRFGGWEAFSFIASQLSNLFGLLNHIIICRFIQRFGSKKSTVFVFFRKFS